MQPAAPKISRNATKKTAQLCGKTAQLAITEQFQSWRVAQHVQSFLRHSMYEAVSINAIMTHESQRLYRKETFNEGFL